MTSSSTNVFGEAEGRTLQFFPWPLPAAIFLALGIALAGAGIPWWGSLPAAALCGWAVSLWPLQRRELRILIALTLLVPLGHARYAVWQGQPNVLEALYAQQVTISGQTDGRYLRVDAIDGDASFRGTQVALAPVGEVAAGRVALTGDLVEPAGKRNPGGFDYRGYLERRGVGAQVFVREVLEHEPHRSDLRERLRQGVVAGLPDRSAALMQAMTLGIRDHLGDLRDIFAASGLAHLLALSGLHVGILMVAVGMLLSPVGWVRYPLLIAFALLFAMMVGASPSVVRAALMVSAVLATLWFGSGRIEPWPALGLAALLTLLWNPSWLFDISFQLSYLAVAGILTFVEPAMKALFGDGLRGGSWWDWRSATVGVAVVSLAAQAFTYPLVAHAFGSVPLFSPLVNILAIPLATLLVPLGFLAGVVGLLSSAVAGALNLVTGLLARLLINLADVAAALPSLPWGEIESVGFALYAFGMLGMVLAARGMLRLWRGLLVALVAVLTSTILIDGSRAEVVFLDVGQGDGVVMRMPGGVDILVDGGGTRFSDFDVGDRIVVPALRALGVRKLDLVVATHAHIDHMEGLVAVVEQMPVQLLVIGAKSPDRPVFRELLAAAAHRDVPVEKVYRGETLRIGDVRLDVVNPPHNRYGDIDADSVGFVLHLRDRPKGVFLGDMPVAVEDDIAFPDVRLLMVPHHGSRHSTSEGLLLATRPDTAVISYGRNNYGHPHPDVLNRLAEHDVDVLETFVEGAVRIQLNR